MSTIRRSLMGLIGAGVVAAGLMTGYSLNALTVLGQKLERVAFEQSSDRLAAHNLEDAVTRLLKSVPGLSHSRDEDQFFERGTMLWGELADFRAQGNALLAVIGDESLRTQGSEALGTLTTALSTLHREVSRRIDTGAESQRLASVFSDLHASFIDDVNAVERNIRARVNVALASGIAMAGNREALQLNVDEFIEREMSWLATVYDLRSDINRLAAVVNTILGTRGVEELGEPEREAAGLLIHLGQYKRLPASRWLDRLAATTEGMGPLILGVEGLIQSRKREYSAIQSVDRALKIATGRLDKAAEWASRIEAHFDRIVGSMVADARQETRKAQFLIVGIAIVAGISALFAIYWLVARKLVVRLERLTDAMTRAVVQREPIAAVAAAAGRISFGRRDEISAMADALCALIRMLEQQREELVRAKYHAEEASRAKTLFLANMSHELRTPLNSIIGFSDVLLSSVFGKPEPKFAEYLAFIRKSGQHLLGLISDLLDISQIESGRIVLNETTLSVAEEIEAVREIVAIPAREAGVDINIRLAPELPHLRADSLRLRQILLNLAGNAIKFTPRGSVTLAAETSSGGIRVTVEDTGIGMREQDIETAMSLFGRIHGDSFTRYFDGTGLGLPLAKGLAELHGGNLEISSLPGVGTRVSVTFPAIRSVSEAASQRPKVLN